jgi:hypothetical protein
VTEDHHDMMKALRKILRNRRIARRKSLYIRRRFTIMQHSILMRLVSSRSVRLYTISRTHFHLILDLKFTRSNFYLNQPLSHFFKPITH